MKKFNLIAKEFNILHENDGGLNLFGEQDKKFVLKTPKPEVEEPTMEPEMDFDMGTEEGGEEELDMELDAESPSEMEDEISIKEIQKLTGKLGQKLRTIDSQMGLSSEDIKYVLNSIISAIDLEKLSEEDLEDILANFEDDEIDYGVDDEADLDIDAGDELDLDSELDMDMDVEEPIESEMYEGGKIMDEIFSESKIDKVLSKYFTISKDEKTLNETKSIKKFLTEKTQKVTIKKEMISMCETVEQELTADFLLKENNSIKFLGKTNKGNLVFENEGQQIEGVIALSWEDSESEAVTDDKFTRLVFKYGDTVKEVEDKIYERDIILTYEKNIISHEQ